MSSDAARRPAGRRRPSGRSLLEGALVVVAAAIGGCTSPPAANVVLISFDTVRADHLGAYGYPRDTSPQLDALAEQSVVFERAFSQASSTRPAHRALFHSRLASDVRDDDPTLAEALSRRGYETVAFTGGGNVAGALGFERGFDRYEEHDGGLAQSLPRAEEWLRARDTSRPFLLFLHTYDAHLPYDPPEPHASLWEPEYDGPVSVSNIRDFVRAARGSQGAGGAPVAVEDRRKVVALYDGGIHYADAWLGRLFALLRELELMDASHVVVFSDHGEEFWEHGGVVHSHTLYAELIHVPLVWRLPGGRSAGLRVAAPVALMDVAPTLLDVLGAPGEPRFRGSSLAGWVDGGTAPIRPVVSEIETLKAYVEWPWKLVWNFRSDRRELYDLARDPGEGVDVIDTHAEQADALQRRLRAALREPDSRSVPELDGAPLDEAHAERLRALGYLE